MSWSPTLDTVRDLAHRLKRWEKWGPDDELGAANFITPAVTAAAARLVRQGKVLGLGMTFDANGPQRGVGGRHNPLFRMTVDGGDIACGHATLPGGVAFTDDWIAMPLQCGTQWDALSHCFFDGKMWGGRGPDCVSSRGAQHNAITAWRSRIATRGLLLDIPALTNRAHLEAGEPVMPEDLEAALARADLTVRPGDVLLIRTGWLGACRARPDWGGYAGGPSPGVSLRCVEWFAAHEIAGYATDTWATEVIPFEAPGIFTPVHAVAIVALGLMLGEIWELDALAADCAADGVFELFLVAPPLPVAGAVGSPINPQAIK